MVNLPSEASSGEESKMDDQFLKEDPFRVFGLPLSYNIDEEALRRRYFQLCRDHAQDAESLALTHKSYRQLMDPTQRLEALSRLRNICLDADSAPLPPDIVALYEEAAKQTTETWRRFQDHLEDLFNQTERQIQEAFDLDDMESLPYLYTHLKYLQKLRHITPPDHRE